ncbi:penicillin-binding protein 2 [Mangrovactinospora gilvigrisea]|uniref:Penicillin-binding protein 2 n=1 Tax=Mangrovactinospora gilvigrisea TaxID=1428644 RepID=A0A1J7BW90_9ACTN|nr:penicillin-binding protein 2 [Mangrovactinospora gilvigrisea]OIV37737.1 penicillin-binding protein 2 [Mangrovactinospora gilvigrisea]
MSNIPETGRTPRVTLRLIVVQIVALSLLVTLGGRLWYLQIREGDHYTEAASSNHIRQIVTPAVRGSILDTNGVAMADNNTALVVSVSRTDLLREKDGGKAVLTRLAGVLGTSYKDVADKVRLCDAKTPQPCWKGSPYQPIPVTDKATTRQALQIAERREDFPGVTAEPTAVRTYESPDGVQPAQFLGYTGPVTDNELQQSKNSKHPFQPSDSVGRSGLEAQYDSALRGGTGVDKLEVDNLGRVVGSAGKTPAAPGDSVVTSIDARVQAVLQKQLEDALKRARTQVDPTTHTRYKGDSGAAVVLDAHTGRVIAMASAPTYDPNVWVGGISQAEYAKLTGKDSDYPLLNRVIQGTSAPGSTFKVISTSAALAAGFNKNSTYPCPSGISIGGQTLHNDDSESYGDITLPRALEVSCNTFFAGLSYAQWQKDGGIKPHKHPNDWFMKRAAAYGLGKKTGIDLPSETGGTIAGRQWKQQTYDRMKSYWCKQAKTGNPSDYVTRIAKEDCVDGYQWRPGDAMNFAIGQGDTAVTPLQMARIYAAVFNGGTLWEPQLGKAIVSADGKTVEKLAPKVASHLPDSQSTLSFMQQALVGVSREGTAAPVYAGFPLNKIPIGSKTGTAQVYGKQATSWFASASKDFAVVMTVSQGGYGFATSGFSVRKVYDALYGVQKDGSVDDKKALMPHGEPSTLPDVKHDGTVDPPTDRSGPTTVSVAWHQPWLTPATRGGGAPATPATAPVRSAVAAARRRRRGGPGRPEDGR